MLGRVAQSVARMTHEPKVPGLICGLATYFFSSSADSRRAVVSYWRKYGHEVLINCSGGLSLSRKGVIRLTDFSDMTIDVYRGCKTTRQQQQLHPNIKPFSEKGKGVFIRINMVCAVSQILSHLEVDCCCCVVVLRPRLTSKVMSGGSVNLTTLFLDRLRPPKR